MESPFMQIPYVNGDSLASPGAWNEYSLDEVLDGNPKSLWKNLCVDEIPLPLWEDFSVALSGNIETLEPSNAKASSGPVEKTLKTAKNRGSKRQGKRMIRANAVMNETCENVVKMFKQSGLSAYRPTHQLVRLFFSSRRLLTSFSFQSSFKPGRCRFSGEALTLKLLEENPNPCILQLHACSKGYLQRIFFIPKGEHVLSYLRLPFRHLKLHYTDISTDYIKVGKKFCEKLTVNQPRLLEEMARVCLYIWEPLVNTEEEAAKAYDIYAILIYGSLAETNYDIAHYDIERIRSCPHLKQHLMIRVEKCLKPKSTG
eukprot:Gb_07299 [translate_table: standard]